MADISNSSRLSSALKQLAASTKVLAFYPSQHPTVESSLTRAAALLGEALAGHESLTLSVVDAGFQVDGKMVGEGEQVLVDFATYLRRRDISELNFRPPVGSDAARSLLEVIALDPGTLRAQGGAARGLAAMGRSGISMVEFDVDAAMRSARTQLVDPDGGKESEGQISWSDLLARRLAGEGALSPEEERLTVRVARDHKAAWDLMSSLQRVAATAATGRAGLLKTALGRVGTAVAAAEPGAIPSLARNLAEALFALDAPGRTSLLGLSIPVPRVNLDLASVIRKEIPEERLGELIVSMVQSEGNLNARLGTVIRKVLIDRSVRDEQRETILESLRAARASEQPTADVWDSVEDLVKESQDDWISREYRGFLELLGSGAPPLEESLKNQVLSLPGFTEALTEEGIRRRTWMLFSDLATIDQEPARQWVALDELAKRVSAITADWFAECGDVVESTLSLLAGDPAPPPHVREAALKALRATSEALIRCYRTAFHHLTTGQHAALGGALAVLGEHGVQSLLDGLAEEEDWEVRKPLLSFLSARGKTAAPRLLRSLSNPSWYFVRNILLILGEIADPGTLPAIAPMLKHPEQRVRKEAAATIGRIGGQRAVTLLKECLDDQEICDVAMRALATIDRRCAMGAALEIIAQVNVFGRGGRRLTEAILLLGVLGGDESVPRLRSILMRGWWLPPSTGDAIRIAAARALGKIGTATALDIVERGTRLWRSPVRSACAEIVSRRSGSGWAPAPR